MSLTGLEQYHRPQQPKEVIELLTAHEDEALIVSGGTFIHGLVARGLIVNVKHLIDISGLNFSYINYDSNQLKIGATTVFRQLENDVNIQNDHSLGAIKDALTYPPAQVKNAASLGGCIASSCPFLDLPISLLALDTSATAFGSKGDRDIHLEEFFVSLFDNAMDADEILKEVTIPLVKNSASAFAKLETNANDLAILNAAVNVTAKGKMCEAIRVFVGGGVGEVPVRATSSETALVGQELKQDNINQAAASAKQDVDPLSDHRASAEYRVAMAEVLIRRCINSCINRLGII